MNDAEKRIKKFVDDRGWNKLRPSDLAKSIAIEAAELLEVFQWSSPEADEVHKDKEKISKIKGELADVFIYCHQMSFLLGIDAQEIIVNKIKVAEKKYPARLFKNDGKKAENTSAYWKIKRQYRRTGK